MGHRVVLKLERPPKFAGAFVNRQMVMPGVQYRFVVRMFR